MAASAVATATIRRELQRRELPKPGTQPPILVLGEKGSDNGLRARTRTLLAFWESLKSEARPRKSSHVQKQDVVPKELWRPFYEDFAVDATSPPPSYEDSVQDQPPDYTKTDSLAYTRCLLQDVEIVTNSSETRQRGSTRASHLWDSTRDVKVDFNVEGGFREHSKKKAKKAAAAAQKAKWADRDDEEKKDEGAGGEGNGGGEGGNGDGGGDSGGGDAPGGDDEGGGDDDWWNGGSSSKKDKKNKKSARKEAEEEEEEERKKEEEEAAANADAGASAGEADTLNDWGSFATVGKKKKKKGAAALEPEPEPGPPQELEPEPVPAGDAAAEEDFGGFATKKGKKKKGKNADPEAESEPAKDPEPEPVPEPPPADDDPGAFASVGKKKDKKKKGSKEPESEVIPKPEPEPPKEESKEEDDLWGSFGKKDKKSKKKSKNDPEPPKDEKSDMKFDDINLNDDKAAPKLDLDFGGSKKDAAAEKSSGFSFGNLGLPWGGGTSSWSFRASDTTATTEALKEDTPISTGWGFTSTASSKSKKKDDKKTTSNAFDFSFDDNSAMDNLDLGVPAGEEPNAEAQDPWAGMSAKEKKKAKKKGASVVADSEPIVVAPPPPPSEPVAPPPAEDPWEGFMSAKDKKKSKKSGKTSMWDPEPEPVVVVPGPAPEPPKEEKKEEDDLWSPFGMSAKDKKPAKKAGKGVAKEGAPAPEPEPEPEPIVEAPKEEDGFVGWGMSTKKKDQKKKDAFGWSEEPAEPAIVEVPPPPEPEPPANDWLGGGLADTTTKKKKGKKGVIEEPAPPPQPHQPVADAPADDADWFSGWGSTDKKSKKKGATALTAAVPDPPVSEELEPEAVVEPKADEECMNSWSTGTKKKASRKDKTKGVVEVVDPSPGASVLLPDSVQEKSAEEDPWSSWTTGTKSKKKGAKRESALDPVPGYGDVGLNENAGTGFLDMTEPPAEDPWSFPTTTTSKKDKKAKKGTKAEPEAIAEVPIPLTKSKSKDSKSSAKAPVDDILNIVEDIEPEPEPEPIEEDKKAKKEEKSVWGSSLWGSTSKKETPKEKKAREAKEKKEKEEREAAEAQRKADEEAFAAALGDENDLEDLLDEPALPPPSADKKKPSKDAKTDKRSSFKDTKLSKVDSKSSKTSEPKEELPIVDIVPEEGPMLSFDEPKKADGWAFWGSSTKSSKKATPVAETNSKIATDPWANQDASPDTGVPKMPDISFGDDGFDISAMSPLSKAAGKDASKLKSSKGNSIQDRIKALNAESTPSPAVAKSGKYKKLDSLWAPVAPAPPEPEIVPEPEPEPEPVVVVEEKRSKKSDKKFKKNKEPEIAPPPPPSISPLPGGFPTEEFGEDIQPEPEMPASPPAKKSSRDKKSFSKSTKDSKKKPEPVADAPPQMDLDDLIMDPPELPTPPPEEPSKKEPRSTKKERPKVVRDQQSSSWGFWGATPAKKTSKDKSGSKDDRTSPKAWERPAGLSRSKSARAAGDKDPLEKSSKSSGSDKDRKESKSRSSTSRGFSLFGAALTPSRSKSTRGKSSGVKLSTRRHSTAVENSGLVSPPAEVSDKAAKVLGRSTSTREKATRKIPDPYPIDSDDMIVLDADVPEDSAKDIDDRRDRKKSSKSKRQSTRMSGGLGDFHEDMVDAPGGPDEAKVFSGPDDLQFVERPTPPRRTSTAKKGGLMGGLLGAFGGGSARPTLERRQSKYDSDAPGSRRKRDSVYDDDYSKRLRREDRKVGRSSRKASDGDGLTDAAPQTDVDEDREQRRRERRERREREREAAEEADRAARRKEKEDRRRAQAREEEDRLAREGEERRQRRREERRARREEEERQLREEERAREERRERRREKEAAAARPVTSDRRRSYMDNPDDEEARRFRREERRLRRSVDAGAGGGDKERPRTSRRRSDYPVADDYFGTTSRGEPNPTSPHADPHDVAGFGAAARSPFSPVAHAIKTGGDKTLSWVDSINDEPPPPPPVEGTIVDAPMHFAADQTPDRYEDELPGTAREYRNRKRQDVEDEDEERRRRRRERREAEGVKSSDGSSQDRRRTHASGASGYGDMRRGYDARPAMPERRASKGGSWLKKITGL
ncbi:hypothetical protein AC579_5883 [Pseudocercospora musae]|uniref:Uncharacterized protein n=1 Tax=Pseudocercospora musae TaxID=113226 RepID=A0A139ISZ5_9PEZI|nr:hypothetical protein AC579_5883 [Pseudocercospora musae]KXT17855.1 hypothetical protein AC579_5883 [Pseudocercospora musae]